MVFLCKNLLSIDIVKFYIFAQKTMIGDLKTIKALIKKLPKELLPIRLMEVCGTHTVAISRMGIRPLLRGEIELISGPGCPVCVTPANFVAKAIWLAENGCTVATFGDMMKVPAGDDSLFKAKARGCDIRVVYSPMDALEFASLNSENHVVFLGIGFETTAPTIAGAILEAEKRKLGNFSVLCGLKTIPRPLEFIASSDELSIDGFILPGHVSAIIGRKAYEFIAEKFGKPGTITGFEDGDIIEGVAELIRIIMSGKPRISNAYTRVVRENGNERALDLIEQVLIPCDSSWRGLGMLSNSGLRIREEFSSFDSESRFTIPEFSDIRDNPACLCDKVILGAAKPTDCELFGIACTPSHPQGPCMISSEGACAAYFKYGE